MLLKNERNYAIKCVNNASLIQSAYCSKSVIKRFPLSLDKKERIQFAITASRKRYFWNHCCIANSPNSTPPPENLLYSSLPPQVFNTPRLRIPVSIYTGCFLFAVLLFIFRQCLKLNIHCTYHEIHRTYFR